MPERGFIDDLDQYLSPYDSKRITPKQLKAYERSYIAGWEFPTEHIFEGEKLSLRLLFKVDNRYVLPDVSVFPCVLDVLKFPHVENESRLCVWDSVACCDYGGLEYLVELLNEASNLLGNLLKGGCVEDFRNGFLSYWAYNIIGGVHGASLCDPSNLESRNVYLYKSKQLGLVFGDTEDQVRAWLINRNRLPKVIGKQTRAQKRMLARISPTALFCFDNAWIPEEYPSSIEELRQLVVPDLVSDEQFADLIGNALNNRIHNELAVLAAFRTDNGICFAGLSLPRGIFSQKHRYSGGTILDGFRDSIPHQHLIHRAATIKTLGFPVSRADAEWVHGRGENAQLSEIQATKVVIVGCGSVGSGVVKLLVKSGVSKIVLIDGDSLGFENLSRHELGLLYVGKNKALSLQEELQRNFPHIEIISFGDAWQTVLNGSRSEELRAQLDGADLILSATADWGSDLGLIDMQNQMGLGPIIFAFTEAHAAASHIIVHPDGSNSFQITHVMNGQDVGSMKTPCCVWDRQTRVRLPICGGAFQPYGAAALSYLHAVAAETILGLITGSVEVEPLTRIWLGDSAQLQAEGGRWNQDWIDRYGHPGQGNRAVRLHLVNDNWESDLA